MQGAVKRATHRVDTVHPLDRLLDLFWRHQAQRHMDPANHQYTILGFHLPSHIRCQPVR